MTTLRTVEDLWITLMLVAALMTQASTALLTPDQVALLHQLRARLHTSGEGMAGALEATRDLDGLLAALEEG
jgi:hypothetical protein